VFTYARSVLSEIDEPGFHALADAALARRIVAAAPAVDEGAEAELCRRFGPRVRLYGLKHLRSPAAASDLVQDVLIVTLQSLRAGKLRESERLASFVLGTCRQVVVDQRRTRSRRERLLSTFPDEIATVEPFVMPALEVERLKHCLQRLTERERAVMLMSFYDERPAAEVAQELSLSAANVRVIRHRSLGRLRNCITNEGSGGAAGESS